MILGQFNIARARWPLNDPRMADFTNNAPRINALAERSDGFIWRLVNEGGPDAPNFAGDPLMTFTLSVWRDIDSLRAFTWNTLHKRFRMLAPEWFEPQTGPYLAIWPISEDHRPNGTEALAKLDQLAQSGPSRDVFGVEVLMPKGTSIMSTV